MRATLSANTAHSKVLPPLQRETPGVRRGYHHSFAISKSRSRVSERSVSKSRVGVSAGLGGFVGFRQLPRRPDECDRLAKIDRASGSERPTGVTAKNLRSRRPEFFARAQGPRATRAEQGVECEGPAIREGFADEAVKGGRVV